MSMLINLLILRVDQHDVFVNWSTNTVTINFISWSSTSYIMLINTWNEAIDQQALKTMLINKQLCTVEQHCVLACLSTLFYSSWTIATFPFFPIILFCQSSVFSHKLIIHFIHYGDQHPKKYPWSTVGDDTVDQVPIMGCLSTGGDDTVDQLRWCLQWSSHLFFPTQYLMRWCSPLEKPFLINFSDS